MWEELGCYARKAWRMTIESFNVLHETLQTKLEQEFKFNERARGQSPNGEIPTKLRLSAALRFFAVGGPLQVLFRESFFNVCLTRFLELKFIIF